MVVDKAKLMAASVDKLKAVMKAKKLRLDDPKTGKPKTKVQLVNSIIMNSRLTGGTNKAIDAKRKAKDPGKRVSKTGKVYTERRANRADLSPTTMLGGKKMTATEIKAKEFRLHLREANRVVNDILKAEGTKQMAGLRKQLMGEMGACKRCYPSFLAKTK